MKRSERTLLTAGALLLGLSAATPAFAISGCTNQNIMGTYNAQISSASFTSVLNTLGATGSTVLPGGFGSNAASIAGSTPALSRFYFDGAGNILGVASAGSSVLSPAGVYSVASNCTAAITLNSGQHYNAVVVNGGNQIMFLQSDAASNGVTGMLQRSNNSCVTPQYPVSFGFSYYGAAAAPAATGSTGSTGSTGVTGSTGTTGVTGSTGTTGVTGSTGTTGVTGSTGTTGVTGSTGTTGVTGSTGTTGSTGSTGTTGSTGSTGTTGTTGTTTTTTTTTSTFTADSAIGVLSLDGAGNFAVTLYSVNGAAGSQSFSGSGTYSVNNNCSLSLTFATPAPGATGALQPPASLAILLGASNSSGALSGLLTIQPITGLILPGVVISQ